MKIANLNRTITYSILILAVAREYQLIPNNFRLKVDSRTNGFEGPQVPIEDLGRVHLWGDFQNATWEKEDLGFAVIRNRVIRKTALEFDELGYFNLGVHFYGYDTRGKTRILSTIKHPPSQLHLEGIMDLMFEELETRNNKFHTTNTIWYEGEDPTPLYWFGFPSRNLSVFRFSFEWLRNLA